MSWPRPALAAGGWRPKVLVRCDVALCLHPGFGRNLTCGARVARLGVSDLRKLAVQNGQVFRRAANLPFEGSFPIWPRSTKFFAVEYLWWKNLDVTYW